MKKKDLIFYAGTAVLFAFSTQQVKADEQHASDQTPEIHQLSLQQQLHQKHRIP